MDCINQSLLRPSFPLDSSGTVGNGSEGEWTQRSLLPYSDFTSLRLHLIMYNTLTEANIGNISYLTPYSVPQRNLLTLQA